MSRRFLVFGIGALALMWVLGDPGQLQAQRFRSGFGPGSRPMINPGMRSGFRPGFGFTPRFGTDPRFRGGNFDRRMDMRFRGGNFDRRMDMRSRGGNFDPRMDMRSREGIFGPRIEGGFFDPR